MKRISKFSKIIGAATLICGLLAVAQVAVAQDYDLVILNGRVMDPESMYDAVANVGVNDGRIAVITKDEITGKKTIDATGHVVAPGFIDTHWHYDRPWSNKLALRDGRTTVLDLEIGTHGPYLDQWYKERVGKNQVNYGQAVAHEFARAEVLDGFTDGQDTRSAANSRAVGNGWAVNNPTSRKATESSSSWMKGCRRADSASVPPSATCATVCPPASSSNCRCWPGATGGRPAHTSATHPEPTPPRPTASRSCSPTRRPWARRRWRAISTTPAITWCTSYWSGCGGAV